MGDKAKKHGRKKTGKHGGGKAATGNGNGNGNGNGAGGAGHDRAGTSASGFHLPPDVRETGARLLAAAASPAGRELLATGIAVAAAAAQAALRNAGAAKPGGAPAPAAPIATPAVATPARPGPEPAGSAPAPGQGGTTRAPDAQAIAATIGTVAESLFAQFMKPRKG